MSHLFWTIFILQKPVRHEVVKAEAEDHFFIYNIYSKVFYISLDYYYNNYVPEQHPANANKPLKNCPVSMEYKHVLVIMGDFNVSMLSYSDYEDCCGFSRS